MKVCFTDQAWDDYRHWQHESADTFEKLAALIEECRRTPFKGTGKPEPLKGPLSGWWSRRITLGHRLVYRVEGSGEAQQITIAAARYHY